METKYITDLILNCRYHEACKEVVEKELEMQTLYPSKHQHWRHVMRAELRALTPSSKLDYQTNIAFYLCLSTCFEHLNDEPSKLAAQYQVVVNMFKSNSHLYEKVELLTKFGGECVENGYLQQAIMTYEELIRRTNDTSMRDTLLHGLRQLYQERFQKYFLENSEIFAESVVPSPIVTQPVERKAKGVRKAEQELERRRAQRARFS